MNRTSEIYYIETIPQPYLFKDQQKQLMNEKLNVLII